MPRLLTAHLGSLLIPAVLALTAVFQTTGGPEFEAVQPATFAAPGALTNAWADFDNDGDLDLFVGFSARNPNRLYRNDQGTFVDVAAAVGVADLEDTRGAAWGDMDADGFVDLYVGFAGAGGKPNRLYRNDGGKRFADVAAARGVAVTGVSRQISWIDFDTDGDLDLFVAFREKANLLFRNDGGAFSDVAQALGIADTRRTIGAAWFDFDEDGDLDAFFANQDGDANGLFRNERTRFVDVAPALKIDAAGRARTNGSVGTCIGDYDVDGRFDLFVANYGPSFLLRNTGGAFEDVAPKLGLAVDHHNDACSWGDFDHDGRPDLYVSAFLAGTFGYRDYLYHNRPSGFVDVLPPVIAEHDADHGVQWADFDRDGDLDLALADSGQRGSHSLFRNLLPKEIAARSLQVMVVDQAGRFTRAGSEVRVYAAGTRRLLGSGIVDTGSGYDTQNAAPVHIGLPTTANVDVEVTSLRAYKRIVTRQANASPAAHLGKWIAVRVP